MSAQINLKEKNITELKAIAFDLTNVAQQYNQMLQIVTEEIKQRAEAEKAAADAAAAETEKVEDTKVKSIKKAKN